jgi:hypothetical protein
LSLCKRSDYVLAFGPVVRIRKISICDCEYSSHRVPGYEISEIPKNETNQLLTVKGHDINAVQQKTTLEAK